MQLEKCRDPSMSPPTTGRATSALPKMPSSGTNASSIPTARRTRISRIVSTKTSGTPRECCSGHPMYPSEPKRTPSSPPRLFVDPSKNTCGSQQPACMHYRPRSWSSTSTCEIPSPPTSPSVSPPPLLPDDLLDIVFRYKHELALRPSLVEIQRRYAEHKKVVDKYVEEAWADWNAQFSPRMFNPEYNAPGGTLHKEYLSRWHHLRLSLRRCPPGDRSRYIDLD